MMSWLKKAGRIGLGIATGGVSELAIAGGKALGGAIQSDFAPQPFQPDRAQLVNPAIDAPIPQTGFSSSVDRRLRDAHQQEQERTGGGYRRRVVDRAFTPRGTQIAIDTANADAARVQGQQSRLLQQHGLGMMQDAAQGGAPSVAQGQLQMGMDQNVQQAHALASSARGGAGAGLLAQRGAQQAAVQAGQEMAGQQAILRAGEMATARGQFADATAAARAGDLGMQQQEFAQAAAQAGIDVSTLTLDDQFAFQNLAAAMGIDQQTLMAQIAAQGMDLQSWLAIQNIGAQVDMSNTQNVTNFAGGLMQGVGGAAGLAAMSDRTAKDDVKPADRGKLRIALSEIKPTAWKYKPEFADDFDGEHYGIIAQDLAKTDVGRSLLTTRQGKLAIDVSRATGFSLGALSDLNERISKLEKGKG